VFVHDGGRNLRRSRPRGNVPIVFGFRDHEVPVTPNLAPLILEPDQRRPLVVWRSTTALGRKLIAPQAVLVGPRKRFV
jgi:hypothetical protein